MTSRHLVDITLKRRRPLVTAIYLLALINLASLSSQAQVMGQLQSPTPVPAATPTPPTQAHDGSAAEPPPEQLPIAGSDSSADALPEPGEAMAVNNPILDRNKKDRKEFPIPLRFDPEDNGLSIDNPQLKWLVTEDDKLDLGGMTIRASMIGFTLNQVLRDKVPARFDIPNAKKGAALNRYLTTVSFRWPEALTKTGDLTVENTNGKLLWAKEITDEDLASWKSESAFANAEMMNGHKDHSWGQFDVPLSEFRFLCSQMPFRICLTKKNSDLERLQICSRPYVTRVSKDQITLYSAKVSAKIAQGFSLNKRPMPKTGVLNFTFGTPFHIKMVYSDSSSIDLSTQPADPKLLDVVQGQKASDIIITGMGAQPLGRVKVIQRPKNFFWSPTGYSQDRIWRIKMNRQNPTVRILGTFNIPFTLFFNADRIPQESDRVYVKDSHSTGTYGSSPLVEGYNPGSAKISSNEISATQTDSYHFKWTFAAPKKGEDNRAKLLVLSPNQDKPWMAHYRLYRSYPYEISARMTGIIDSSFTVIILAEISAAAWFDTLASINNSVISKQRWGIAGQYFKGLTPIQTSGGSNVNDFSVAALDLKYNLIPGVWHRDEIVGLNTSFERVTIAGLTANLGGVGLYWARTMPKIFNDIFNVVPVFEYPKYVDMQLTYFPLAADSVTTPGTSFNLTFHGRIFWTKQFYGEAGFGIREYSFSQPSPVNLGKQAPISLNMAYGSFGIGYAF